MTNLSTNARTKRRIWVSGNHGMVGSAIVRRLANEDVEILTVDRVDLDLREQQAVRQWVAWAKPDVIILAAAKVGGILANDSYPADFLFDNLAIETNVIQAAHLANVEQLVFLGEATHDSRADHAMIARDPDSPLGPGISREVSHEIFLRSGRASSSRSSRSRPFQTPAART